METFEHLRRADTVLLSTRRRNGTTVDTPVNLAVDEHGDGYFRTWSSSGKARRLRNFPGVRVAPCSVTGRPQGSDQPAVASLLAGPDIEVARAVLIHRFPWTHGRLAPLVDRVRHRQIVYYRLAPAEDPTPWHG